MTLTSGTHIGPYEIVSPLGAGGMGEVYRARDTKLNRDVAIKILPDTFASDGDRVARFTREAQTLATLNHPHIAQIYGLEQSSTTSALVMELVDGEDLAQRIARGPIAIDDALPIARQICEAIEAAHEQGIVHRDLKPGNIKVRADGTVKVLDFGLAKALCQDPSLTSHASRPAAAATATSPAMTAAGMLLGTAAYMAPEQARGKIVDKRADIWAFGCVLYEMLTGRPAFGGSDVTEILASVVKTEPDWSALPPDVPAHIRLLIRGCLEKDPRKRAGDIAVAQFLFGGLTELDASTPAPREADVGRPLWKSASALVATAVVTAALVAAGVWALRPASPPVVVARFSFTLPSGQELSFRPCRAVAISPDGTQLVYAGWDRLYLRALSEFEARPIAGTESKAVNTSCPTFSPDSRSIAFYADGALKRVDLGGGAAVRIASMANLSKIVWDADGILFAQNANGILRVSPNGGTPEPLMRINAGEIVSSPQVLPGGHDALFAVRKGAPGPADSEAGTQIVVQRLNAAERTVLIDGASEPRYLTTGHLVYTQGGTALAVRFDPDQHQIIGKAVPVLEGVRRGAGDALGDAQLGVSDTGTLIYIPGPAGQTITTRMSVVLVDRRGGSTSLAVPPGSYRHARASRDGKRLALGTEDGNEANVWIHDLAGRGVPRRLTFEGHNRFPLWSADGGRVAFQSDREGDLAIFTQPADGTGRVERLTKAEPGESHIPESWSPDGRYLSYSVLKGSVYSLWILSLEHKKAEPFGRVESVDPLGSVFSPDGRWLAYAVSPPYPEDRDFRSLPDRGVYLQPFPATARGTRFRGRRLIFTPSGPMADRRCCMSRRPAVEHSSKWT